MSIFSFKDFKNDEVVDVYQKGIDSQKAGDYKTAIKFLKSAIEGDPNLVEAYNSLGLTYKKMGDFDNALKSYNQGIEVIFQKIFDGMRKFPIKFSNDKYASSKSKTWTEVAIQIATKNCAKDGIAHAQFPTGETALKMAQDGSNVGFAFKDVGDTRYFYQLILAPCMTI